MMSEENEFEVRGIHDDAVEEEAKSDQLAQRIAVITALLSTLGAVFSFQSGHAQTEATFLKSGSIAKLTQASDLWAQYQSKSTRAYVASVAALTAQEPARRKLEEDAKRLDSEKDEVRKQAEQLQEESDHLSKEADEILRPHHRLSLAMTFIQISIALSSLTVLTRQRWLFVLAGVSALGGVGIAIVSWLSL